MVVKCPVIINNGVVTVVKYNDIEVQLPFIGDNIKYVNIDFRDGKYVIVKNNKPEYTKPVDAKQEKKTTSKEEIKPQYKKRV